MKKHKNDADSPQSAILSDDRFDELFELVSSARTESEFNAPLELSDQKQVEEINRVLNLVQAAQPVTTSDIDEVEDRFLRLLAKKEPNHAWLNDSDTVSGEDSLLTEELEVKTLGDVVRFTEQDTPAWVSPQVWDFFSHDVTPIADLTDLDRRSSVLGSLFKKAGVSRAAIPKMHQWMSSSIGSLTPSQNGAFMARRQKKKPNSPR